MTVVLDASAALAVLQQERGSEAVVPLLSGACIWGAVGGVGWTLALR